MVYKELSPWNNFELRVYRLLGVPHFRKFILAFEKIRHFKDKQKNENYHPAGFDIFSLEKYNGFLIYNTFLHSVSLFFAAVYAAISTAVRFRHMALDFVMVFFTLLNIYCILLQRFNYLKLKEHRYRIYRRFRKQTDICKKETIRKVYASDPEKFREDYEVLSRIKKALESQEDCVLTSADARSLRRFCACLEPAAAKKLNRKNKEAPPAGLMEQCCASLRPYTALQMRADWLQRKLGVPGPKILDHTVIITENAECEMLYRELIPEDTAYNFCLVCFRLYEVFAGMIGRVGTDEA